MTCLLIGVLLAGSATAEGGARTVEGWSLVKTTPAGRIYHRDVKDSATPWAEIVTTFDATPGRVHALVVDYGHFAEFIPNVFESRIVAQQGETLWVYHHLRFPGPIADRSYVIRSTEHDCRTRHTCFRIEWVLEDRHFKGVDLSTGVQPKVFSGYWELHSTDKPGRTVARYGVHSDPGGFIPGWLVTAMTDRYLQQVVEAVRVRLGAGR